MDKIYKFKTEKLMLIRKAPALGFIALMLKPQPNKDCPTIGVNANLDLIYNEKWLNQYSIAEKVGILAHESSHVLLQHVFETSGYASVFRKHKIEYNHLIANVAMDMAINIILKEFNFTLPDGGIKPEEKYKHLAVEVILDQLLKENKPQKGKSLDDHSGFGKGDKEGKTANRSKTNINGIKEKEGGEGEGDKDGSLKAEVNKQKIRNMLAASTDGVSEAFKPLITNKVKVPWKTILRNVITSVKSRSKMIYPNRHLAGIQAKVFHNHIIYGKVKRVNVPKLCFFVDVSGSIEKSTINTFLGIVKSIESAVRDCDVVTFNHTIQEKFKLQDLKKPELTIQASGGTNYLPIKNYLETNKYDFIILLTDGYFADKIFPIEKSLAFLICENKEFTEKFGKTILIDD